MKWEQDIYTINFTCPYCGDMVRDNGYGGCDFVFCPYCGNPVEPVKKDEPVKKEEQYEE